MAESLQMQAQACHECHECHECQTRFFNNKRRPQQIESVVEQHKTAKWYRTRFTQQRGKRANERGNEGMGNV